MANQTKKALAAALKQFLNQTTLDKITVTDIAAACDINRQTFYYHFQDIYDLGQWVFEKDMSQLLAGEIGYEHWQSNLLKILLYVEENKVIVQNVYHSGARSWLEKWIHNGIQQIFVYMIETQCGDIEISDEDKQLVANLYSYAVTGWILDWVHRGMREDPRKMVDQFCRLFHGNFEEIRKNFQKS